MMARSEYYAEYYARPEVKKRRAALQAKYMARPENKKHKAEYLARAETKARNRASRARYLAKPENKKHAIKYRAEYSARPETKRLRSETARRRKYGLTPIEYNFMFAAQQFRCAICKTNEPAGGAWHTDHCHRTREIRGILCHCCNTGIGKLGDTADGVRLALEYLERFECQTTQQTTNSPIPIDATVGQSKVLPFTGRVEKPCISSSAEIKSPNLKELKLKSA